MSATTAAPPSGKARRSLRRVSAGGFSVFSATGAGLMAALFGLLNGLIRYVAGGTLAMDDAKTNVFTQVWQWGYQPDNPPLFEWLVILLHPVTGGGLLSFLIIKYAGLVATAVFTYLAVSPWRGARDGFTVAMALVLFYQVGWNFHQAFTHSALLLPAIAAAIWATLRLFRFPNWRSAIILGVTIGIGMLCKYNAALYWLAVPLAAATFPGPRAILFRPVNALAIPVALVIIAPHLIWFLGQSDAYRDTLQDTLGLSQATHLERMGQGLVSLFVSTATFFLPWALVALAVRPKGRTEFSGAELLLLQTSLVSLVGLAIGIMAFGISDVSERYMIPVLLPAGVGLTTVLINGRPAARDVVLKCAATFAVIVIWFRLVSYLFPGDPFCDECGEFVPYEALRAPIAQSVPDGAILIARDENTGGNLVEMFPNSPVRVFTSLSLMNPIKESGRPCYLVWSDDLVGGVPLEDFVAFAYDHPETMMVTAPWSHAIQGNGWRQTVWGITPLKDSRAEEVLCGLMSGNP